MFVIIGQKVHLSNQKYFMFNLAISDCLIAIVGMFRGLGIIDPSFVGFVGGNENGWCSAYLLFMMLVSYSNCPCMVALTIDRVVAIVRPFMHRTLFTKWVCIGICVAVWLPQVLFYCWFMVTMFTNEETVSMEYYPNYHRCQNSYKNPWLRTARFVTLVWLPFSLIILMYSIIIYKVIRSGKTSIRLLAISSVIIVSGFICWFPSIISSIFSIPMNYKVAQVLTVSLFYMSSSTDPLVYVLLMPAVKDYLFTRFVKCEEPPASSSNSSMIRISTDSRSSRQISSIAFTAKLAKEKRIAFQNDHRSRSQDIIAKSGPTP
ncbi:G-protein coupled receptor 183-like [Bolinopsis microptera]|uniref:G-protein coupled receptor 183-like n=1 Tax=Bolinopsis microptera TaxID=2820187 RepID=UPI00307A440B